VQNVAPIHYIGHNLSERDGREHIKLTVEINGERRVVSGEGNGPLDALMHAIGAPVRIQHYEERSLTQGADSRAVAVAEMAGAEVAGSAFGVGIDANLVTASIRAVISGVNRAYARANAQAKASFFDAALNDAAQDVAV